MNKYKPANPPHKDYDHCLDCKSLLVPCDCRTDCSGAMCGNPKCVNNAASNNSTKGGK